MEIDVSSVKDAPVVHIAISSRLGSVSFPFLTLDGYKVKRPKIAYVLGDVTCLNCKDMFANRDGLHTRNKSLREARRTFWKWWDAKKCGCLLSCNTEHCKVAKPRERKGING